MKIIWEKKLKANPTPTQIESEKKKLSFKEIKEYEELESIISDLEVIIQEKTKELNNTTDHQLLSSLAKEVEILQKQLDQKSDRWIELAEYM